ncbi:hypothetical protein T265_03459 [Opisthorchis viverrini]|uniref:Uncharacterized protein n=1 Tax=Opisthorchis viverrini TaxID=6198 RepID=A0A074ZSK0_OPIVI|nr:hypothetical protein T265_03459 [Opisthorchis viverrini]KER30096.1 hypothetical protein T265_03459 [Opisthorchis viverrini]
MTSVFRVETETDPTSRTFVQGGSDETKVVLCDPRGFYKLRESTRKHCLEAAKAGMIHFHNTTTLLQ